MQQNDRTLADGYCPSGLLDAVVIIPEPPTGRNDAHRVVFLLTHSEGVVELVRHAHVPNQREERQEEDVVVPGQSAAVMPAAQCKRGPSVSKYTPPPLRWDRARAEPRRLDTLVCQPQQDSLRQPGSSVYESDGVATTGSFSPPPACHSSLPALSPPFLSSSSCSPALTYPGPAALSLLSPCPPLPPPPPPPLPPPRCSRPLLPLLVAAPPADLWDKPRTRRSGDLQGVSSPGG